MSETQAALDAAVEHGDIGVIQEAVRQGTDVNTADNYGNTAVYITAHKGHVDAIRTFAELGADVNTPDISGWTLVYVAALEGHVDAI